MGRPRNARAPSGRSRLQDQQRDRGRRDAATLETRSLLLRPFRLEDASAAYALSNEAAFRRWLPSQVYADETDARRALHALIAPDGPPADPRLRPVVFALEHRGDGLLIGHVGLSPFRADVEVGFAVAEAYQRRGFAAEAVVAACVWALERFELRSIVAIAAESNQASRRVLARAGFESLETRLMDFQGTEQAVSVYRFRRPRRLPGGGSRPEPGGETLDTLGERG